MSLFISAQWPEIEINSCVCLSLDVKQINQPWHLKNFNRRFFNRWITKKFKNREGAELYRLTLFLKFENLKECQRSQGYLVEVFRCGRLLEPLAFHLRFLIYWRGKITFSFSSSQTKENSALWEFNIYADNEWIFSQFHFASVVFCNSRMELNGSNLKR